VSCKHKRAYSFLDFESEISRQACKFNPGASADHAVTITSYAVFDVEVGFHCGCPNGALSYPHGYNWDPDPVILVAKGIRKRDQRYTLHENLTAANAVPHLPLSEQLKLEPRRRALPAGLSPVLPVNLSIE
jgi:hypothetical protein